MISLISVFLVLILKSRFWRTQVSVVSSAVYRVTHKECDFNENLKLIICDIHMLIKIAFRENNFAKKISRLLLHGTVNGWKVSLQLSVWNFIFCRYPCMSLRYIRDYGSIFCIHMWNPFNSLPRVREQFWRLTFCGELFIKRNWVFATDCDFLIPISFQSNVVDYRYVKLWILLD